MPRHRQFDSHETRGNIQMSTPKHYSPMAVSSYSRNTSFSTPTRSPFRKYALSDSLCISSPNQQKTDHQNKISTMIESKSPGYTSRVVQYSEEQEKSMKSPRTHHSRYDQLGVFPVVHFFKKGLPLLKRKSDDSHLNTSDLSKYNTPEHNQKLLEKIIRSSPAQQPSSQKNEAHTKSVLDALKEISRKRIHSNGEDFILKEDGKRMHADFDHGSSSRKRLKQNLSQVEDFVVANSPTQTYSIDELMASRSSMEGCFAEKPQKKIRTEHPKAVVKSPVTPPVKRVNVETQTITNEVETPTVVAETPKDVTISTTKTETKVKRPSPVKIFDEAPLEMMRKNKLTALIGALTPNKTQNQNTNDKVTQENTNKPGLSKPLVGILSGSTKSPHKSPKHVTFDIPDSDESSGPTTTTNNLPIGSSSPSKSTYDHDTVTKTSAALVMPIVSASVAESVQKSVDTSKSALNTDTSGSTQVSSNQSFQFGTLVSPNLTFRSTALPSQNENPPLSGSIDESNKSVIKKPEPIFVPQNTVPSNGANSKTSVSDNSSQGGFKFELKTAPISTTASTSVSFPFGSSTSTSTTPTTSSGFLTTSQSGMGRTSNVFGVPQKSTTEQSTNLFNETNTNKTFGVPSAEPFSFGQKPTSSTNISSASPFTQPSSTTTSSSVAPNFGSKISTSAFGLSSAPASKSSLFNFGNSTTTTTVSNFTNLNSVDTNPKPFSNRNLTTSSLNFPTTSLSSPFNSSSGFAAATTTTTESLPSLFPGSVTKPPTNTTNTLFFGSSNSSFNNNPSTSSGTNNPPGFGSDPSTKPAFGTGAVPSFGTTTASSFGGTNNPTLGTNSFTNPSNPSNNIFGNTGGFGTSSEVPSFGSNTTTNFGTSNFGLKTGFGGSGSTNSDVKTNFTPSFGGFNNAFNVSTNPSGFGTTSNTLSVAPSNFGTSGNFGSSNNNALSSPFGTSSPFDKPATSATANTEVTPFAFGSSNNFPANPQTSQNNVFSFGVNNNNKPAVFSFGTSEPPKPSFNFQADNKSNAFGVANKGFGSSSSTGFNPMPPTPQFNVQPPGGNMFNIGAGGSSGPNRSRPQHKAKRRT